MNKIVLRSRALRLVFRELAELKPSPQCKHVDIEGHDVVEVTFTTEQAQLVIERAVIKAEDAMKKVGTFGSSRYEEIIRTNKVGFLGKVAWFIYAEDDFPKGLSTIKFGFKKDRYDFLFRGYKGDVKCAGRPNADLMMMPEYRFQKRCFDLYVGSRLTSENPYVVQIWGYVTREELEELRYVDNFGYGLTRCYPLKKLHPIIKLKHLKPKD